MTPSETTSLAEPRTNRARAAVATTATAGTVPTVATPVATVRPPPAEAPGEPASCTGGRESPLRPEAAARYAAVLRALADPHRLRMLALIATQAATEPLCACEIEAAFELSQPTISHHLKVLREAGLITDTKQGLWHYYALRSDGLLPVQQALAELVQPNP